MRSGSGSRWERAGLPFDHASDDRTTGTAVECAKALGNDRVVLRQAAVVSNVIQPRRRLVTLYPDLRISQITQ
jgi:hypothetical protein